MILKVQGTSMSFKSWFGTLEDEIYLPLGFGFWSWFRYGHWSSIHPCSKFWLSIMILNMQRTSLSFKTWFGALEDCGGSWLGFGKRPHFFRIFFGILPLFRNGYICRNTMKNWKGFHKCKHFGIWYDEHKRSWQDRLLFLHRTLNTDTACSNKQMG